MGEYPIPEVLNSASAIVLPSINCNKTKRAPDLETRFLYDRLFAILFRDLELTGIYHFSILITKLENINTPVKITEINHRFRIYVIYFIYFFAQHINNLEAI
jgi:hypothetical protein